MNRIKIAYVTINNGSPLYTTKIAAWAFEMYGNISSVYYDKDGIKAYFCRIWDKITVHTKAFIAITFTYSLTNTACVIDVIV
jgi:hypothetical protein